VAEYRKRGMETGGRDRQAAMCRKRYGNSAPLLNESVLPLSFKVGVYSLGGIGSRAWIALALVFLGFRNVWGIFATSLIFAFAETLSFGVQGLF
jgi:hypothetical protein